MASPMNVGPGLGTRAPPLPANHNIVPAYSLLVAGPPGAGKSSLLRLLLDTAPISPHATQSQLESVVHFVRASTEPRFAECEVEVLANGERVLLRLLDTPGLDFSPGAEDNVERALHDILTLVEDRYVEGARDESTVGESHIHLCLYVLDPTNIVPRPTTSAGYSYRRTSPASSSSSDYSPNLGTRAAHHHYLPSLPQAEINAIRRLSSRVNVLPVLGHCDTVSVDRLTDIKRAVRRNLADAGLGFGIFDEEGEAGVAPTALPVVPPTTLAQLLSSPRPKTDSASPHTESPAAHQYSSPSPPPPLSQQQLAVKSEGQPPADARPLSETQPQAIHSETVPLLPFALFTPECYTTQRRPSKRELITVYTAVIESARERDLSDHADAQRSFDIKGSKCDRDGDQRLEMLRGRFVRRYRWGVLDVLDPRHSDFAALRRAVMSCRKELKTYTKDYLYEKFKVDALLAAQSQARSGPGIVPVAQPVNVSAGHHIPAPVVSPLVAGRRVSPSGPSHDMRGLPPGQPQQAQPHAMPPPPSNAAPVPYGHQSIQNQHQHPSPHMSQVHPHKLPPPSAPPPSSQVTSSSASHVSGAAGPHTANGPTGGPGTGLPPRGHPMQRSPQHPHTLPPIVPSHHHPGSVHSLLNHGHGAHGEVYKRNREEAGGGGLYKREREREREDDVMAYKHEREEDTVYKREREERDRERDGRDAPAVNVLGPENGSGVVPGAVVPATGLTVNGRKRKITMACNFCRSRKLKCDGLRPACAQCVKRGNNCDYQPHAHAPVGVAQAPAAISATTHVRPPTAIQQQHQQMQTRTQQQVQTHVQAQTTAMAHNPQVGAWRYKPSAMRGHAMPPSVPQQATGPNQHADLQHPHTPDPGHHADDPMTGARDRGEDVDELDDDAGSSDGGADSENGGVRGAGTGVSGGDGGSAYGAGANVAGGTGRKRVSVDMLIAETLGDTGAGTSTVAGKTERAGAGAPAQNGEREQQQQQRYPGYPTGNVPPMSTPGAMTNGENAAAVAAAANSWYAEDGVVVTGMGMGVIDVGSEGDKKKRLNRQSANYGSKAVACVHCRARKTRCDAARPACGNCARRSLACSYIHTQPSQPRSKGKKAAAIAAAKEEAARMAATTAKANGTSTGTGDSPGSHTSTTHDSVGVRGSPQLQLQPHAEWHVHHPPHRARAQQQHPHADTVASTMQVHAAQQQHVAPHHLPAHAHAHTNLHANMHPHGHGHGHPLLIPQPLSVHSTAALGARSPLHVAAPASPIRVDDRLIEESAERDRPLTRSPPRTAAGTGGRQQLQQHHNHLAQARSRSPAGPPIATLPNAAASPSSSEPSPVSAITTLVTGSKHDTRTSTPVPYMNGAGKGDVVGCVNGAPGDHHHQHVGKNGVIAVGEGRGGSGSVTPAGDARSRSNSVGAESGGGGSAAVVGLRKRKSPPRAEGTSSDREGGDELERPEKKKRAVWRESEEAGSGDEERARA